MADREEEKPVVITLMILGNSGVGKTTMSRLYTEGRFSQEHRPTQGLEEFKATVVIDGIPVKVIMNDTSADERYSPILKSFYFSSDAHVIVFDVSDRESIYGAEEWSEKIKDVTGINNYRECLLLGNKTDMHPRIPADHARKFGEDLDIVHYAETSCLNARDDVKEAIDSLVRAVLTRKGYYSSPAQEPAACGCCCNLL